MLNNFFGKSVFSGETAINCSGRAQCVITFGPPCITIMIWSNAWFTFSYEQDKVCTNVDIHTLV